MEIYTGLIEFNWTLLFVWLTFGVLYLILKKKFFVKVHDFMVARENMVKDSIENAEQVNLVALRKMDAYDKKIADIEGEGREIIKIAKIKADAQSRVILDEANVKVAILMKQAEEEIQREKLRAVGEVKHQIAGLALLAAEKILEKELDQTGQDELIAGILDKAGKSEWQN